MIDNRKLQKEIDIDTIDTPDTTPAPDPAPVPEPESTPDNAPDPTPIPENEPEKQEPENKPEVPATEPKKEDGIDYKKRYQDSSREALNLTFKNEKLNNILSSDLEVADPTEDDLRKYAKENDGEYDEMDAFTKNVLKRQWVLEEKEKKRTQIYSEIKKVEVWGRKVDEFLDNEEQMSKFQSLEGHEKEFKDYCMKETQRGVDFNLLVGSFLYENQNLTQPKKKGTMLLSQGNGRTEAAKPVGISAEEAETIRITDPKKYRQMIKAGQIDIEI